MILADGEDVRDLLPPDESVRLVHFAESRQVGQKRNYGCELATGEVICHWDDDDYSAPGRLAYQVGRLFDTRRSVVGFHSMRFTDGERWWQYRGERHYALGTSLCYRRDWWHMNRFKSVQVGEDNFFVANAWAAGQLDTTDAGDLMHATIHAGNTSPRTLGDNWKLL